MFNFFIYKYTHSIIKRLRDIKFNVSFHEQFILLWTIRQRLSAHMFATESIAVCSAVFVQMNRLTKNIVYTQCSSNMRNISLYNA